LWYKVVERKTVVLEEAPVEERVESAEANV
jgi:hypothetical protein